MGFNSTDSIINGIREYTNSTYNPDFEVLRTGLFVAEDIAQMLLGFMLVIMYSLLAVLTTIDICYLTLPVFQDYVNKKGWDSVDKHNHSIISRNARDALREANTVETGHSALGLYIKKRYFSILILVLLSLMIFTNYGLILSILKNIMLTIISSVGGSLAIS